MDISTQLRGQLYTTNMVFKCPNFSKCIMCSCCDNYNQHNYMCVSCEIYKPAQMRCTHTDEQQKRFKYVMDVFNKPMSHVDDAPPEVPQSLVVEEKEDVIDDLIKLGRPISES